MLALTLSWGLNQVSVKLALPEIPPFIQATVRSIGAFAVIAIWARMRGVSLTARDGTLAAGLFAGALFGLEFLLIFPALQFTAASRATLFIYTAPFFVAIGSTVLLGERLRAVQWLGLLCSFAGLVVAFGVPDASRDGKQLLGDIMMVGAGAAWGATTLIIKGTKLRSAPAEKVLAYQLLVSIPMLGARHAVHGRAHGRDAERVVARLARLSDVLGGEPHLCGVVRHGAALFGEPAFGVHVPDAPVRRRVRPFRARGTDFVGLCGRGGAGGGRPGAGEPAELTVPHLVTVTWTD